MKIGIDLDDVIVDFTREFLKFYNQKFKKNILYKDWKVFDLWELEPISKEESIKLINEFYKSEFFDEIDLIDGAKEAICGLMEKHEVSVITARPLRWGEKTRSFFEKQFPKEKVNLHHSRSPDDFKIDKAGICKNLKIELIIDDRENHALDCAEKGVKVLLLDKPWNQGVKHENIIRVKNWNEILEKLNRGFDL